eukprot:TRINITY_DN280_c0_g5_i2.p1 TRINITY_DN280_c0_g5~~TRINITY_DN280_c0_g5_i2.p1  ORF type:complete len:683 (+),score=227.75 TRINITY_DN280_c0_g5_i2:121-2049(+)
MNDLTNPPRHENSAHDDDLDSLVNDLVHSNPSANSKRSTTPVRSQDVDELDSLISELAPSQTVNSSNQRKPSPVNNHNNKPVAVKPPPPSNQDNELDLLMDELSGGSSQPNLSRSHPKANNQPQKPTPAPAATRSASYSVSHGELDDLMNDLMDAPATQQKPAPAQKSTVPESSEIDDLMRDLSVGSAPAPSAVRGPSPSLSRPNAAPAQATNYGAPPRRATQASMDMGAGQEQDELSLLMDSISQPPPQSNKRPAAVSVSASVSMAPSSTGNELDDLMNDLTMGPSTTNYKQPQHHQPQHHHQQQQAPPTSELDDLMADLTGEKKPISQPSSRPQQQSNPNVPRGASNVSAYGAPTAKQPAGYHDTDELDELMNSIGGPGSMSNNRPVSVYGGGGGVGAQSSPQVGRPPASSVNARSNPNMGLDEIMASVSNPSPHMSGGPNVGRGPAASVGGPRFAEPKLPKGVCSGCRKPITGEQIQALGRYYHPEHFSCSTCSRTIGSGQFFENEGQPQCDSCYSGYFCNRCFHCQQPITNQLVTALGQSWHANCFVCTNCQLQFADGSFFEHDGRPYCEDCFHAIFSSSCRACNQPIRGTIINALGSQWHPEHFNCQVCHRSFPNGQFFEFSGLPFCEIHYKQKIGR